MINSLYIKNIALIHEHYLNFHEGLNVLSGETGAGKSIIIDSLNFVLGDRADKSLIRHGQSSAVVEAIFDDRNNVEVKKILDEFGIEKDENIIVRRTMTENGRSDCRVNGRAITLQQLRKLVVKLVDIHSQHENQALLNEATHINILDKYSKNISRILESFQKHYYAYNKAIDEIKGFEDEASRQRKIDMLEYQLAEIERVNPQIGEEEELIKARTKFQNAERIANALSSAFTAIDADDNFGALNATQTALREINAITRFDSNFETMLSRLESVKIELRDIADELSNEIEGLNYDPRELEKIEERINDIRKIKKRYGAIESLQEFVEKSNENLSLLKNAEERIFELEKIASKEGEKTIEFAIKLHNERQATAIQFSSQIVKNLKELGMKNMSFEVEITFPENDILAKVTDTGADEIRFLISPNLGEPLKPLAKIASGGEMSRFMLGLKNITAELEGIDTLVFDEIDTGISGLIAKVVAEKLSGVSKDRQVLAVTHLPQLAAIGDHNFLITKFEKDGSTFTNVEKLDEENRIKEVMRLAGSEENSEIGRKNAIELINWAKSKKNS